MDIALLEELGHCALCRVQCAGVPVKFNSDGYLDPGLHNATQDDIEEHLVKPFTASVTRKPIFEGFVRHCSDVSAFGVDVEELLDGSYISNKNDPGDIDLVGFADLYAIDALPPADQVKFRELFRGQLTKATHSCDAYFCPTVASSDPLYAKLRPQRKYWMGEFGFDRVDTPKGLIRHTVLGAKAAAGPTPTGRP